MRYTVKQYAGALKELKAEKIKNLAAIFAAKLAKDRRLKKLPGIISALEEIETSERGGGRITVASAQTNDKELSKKISGAVIKDMPSLLAGLIIEKGDTRIDSSISGRLAKLKTALVSN